MLGRWANSWARRACGSARGAGESVRGARGAQPTSARGRRAAGRWVRWRTHGRTEGRAGTRQGLAGQPAGRSCAHLGVPARLVGCSCTRLGFSTQFFDSVFFLSL